MPPPKRPVTLATAGRQLNGPPEGYGPKQEVKVKRWIETLPASPGPLSLEASAIAAASEVRLLHAAHARSAPTGAMVAATRCSAACAVLPAGPRGGAAV